MLTYANSLLILSVAFSCSPRHLSVAGCCQWVALKLVSWPVRTAASIWQSTIWSLAVLQAGLVGESSPSVCLCFTVGGQHDMGGLLSALLDHNFEVAKYGGKYKCTFEMGEFMWFCCVDAVWRWGGSSVVDEYCWSVSQQARDIFILLTAILWRTKERYQSLPWDIEWGIAGCWTGFQWSWYWLQRLVMKCYYKCYSIGPFRLTLLRWPIKAGFIVRTSLCARPSVSKKLLVIWTKFGM